MKNSFVNNKITLLFILGIKNIRFIFYWILLIIVVYKYATYRAKMDIFSLDLFIDSALISGR